MPKRRPLDSLEGAYDAAIKMLARKSRTTQEVRDDLLEHGASEPDVESVLARLKANRVLDDAVLATDDAFSLVESKGVAPALAVYKLTSRGVAPSIAQDAVDAAREDRSDLELCAEALSRRLKTGRLDVEDVPKQGRWLARLGYDEDVVARVLDQALRGSGE